MLNRICLILVSTAILLGCKQERVENNQTFHLTGDISGFEDSTKIYLTLENGGAPGDSTVMINGKFEFSGIMPDSLKAKQIALHTKRYAQYKFIWIENGSMTIHGDKSDFRHLILTGSKTESENDELNRRMAHSEKLLDSLGKIAQTADEELKVKLRAARQDIFNQNELIEAKFISDYPGSMISAYIINVYTTTWGKAKTAERFALLTAENQNSSFGKSIQRYLSLSKSLGIGDKFVDFEEMNTLKEKIKLSDFSGKIVLLEFWASWCGPCRETNPSLRKTYHQFKDRGFEILAVSLDKSEKDWRKAMEADSLTWPNVSELNGSENTAALIYGVNGIPDNFLIDKRGVIVARGLRGEALTKQLATMLN